MIHQQSTDIVLSVAVNSAARLADLSALLDLLTVIDQHLLADLPLLAEDLVALQSQVANVMTQLSANAVDLTNRVFLLNLQLNALIKDLVRVNLFSEQTSYLGILSLPDFDYKKDT